MCSTEYPKISTINLDEKISELEKNAIETLANLKKSNIQNVTNSINESHIIDVFINKITITSLNNNINYYPCHKRPRLWYN